MWLVWLDWAMNNPPSTDVRICGPRLVLRALRADEIDEEWQAVVTADPMTIADLPDEAGFRARLQRSGRLEDGWLDLAIDLGGVSIGRIQTFVPPGRPLSPGTFEVGIGLRENARHRGYGREALALFTDWLFERAAAEVVEAPTDPANVAMRTVFQRVGWMLAGSLTEFNREWLLYRITRPEWLRRRRSEEVDVPPRPVLGVQRHIDFLAPSLDRRTVVTLSTMTRLGTSRPLPWPATPSSATAQTSLFPR